MTVEKSVFSGSSIGHVLRTRSTNPTSYVQTDTYFHFDQVGLVMAETNAAGALSQTHHQEAFGQTLASWQTGLVGGDRAGLHHNTKEFDGDVGLVYMYQRWYMPETGTFMSRAPYPPMMERPYVHSESDPVNFADPNGEFRKRSSSFFSGFLWLGTAIRNQLLSQAPGMKTRSGRNCPKEHLPR